MVGKTLGIVRIELVKAQAAKAEPSEGGDDRGITKPYAPFAAVFHIKVREDLDCRGGLTLRFHFHSSAATPCHRASY